MSIEEEVKKVPKVHRDLARRALELQAQGKYDELLQIPSGRMKPVHWIIRALGIDCEKDDENEE